MHVSVIWRQFPRFRYFNRFKAETENPGNMFNSKHDKPLYVTFEHYIIFKIHLICIQETIIRFSRISYQGPHSLWEQISMTFL